MNTWVGEAPVSVAMVPQVLMVLRLLEHLVLQVCRQVTVAKFERGQWEQERKLGQTLLQLQQPLEQGSQATLELRLTEPGYQKKSGVTLLRESQT